MAAIKEAVGGAVLYVVGVVALMALAGLLVFGLDLIDGSGADHFCDRFVAMSDSQYAAWADNASGTDLEAGNDCRGGGSADYRDYDPGADP